MTKLVNQLNTLFSDSKSGKKWPAYISKGGGVEEESTAYVVYRKGFGSSTIALVAKSTSPYVPDQDVHVMTVAHAKEIAGLLDDMYVTTSDYRRVLNDPNWSKLFQIGQRTLTYIHGTTLHTKLELTLPCYNCGVVLPSTHITVDHVKPQSGGEQQAILKVLRNINKDLANAGGKGGVAQAFINNTFNALPTRVGAGPRIVDPFEEVNKGQRYTLSNKGMTFLSVAIEASSLKRVGDMCMHSVFNLKPYCAKCNIKKTNKVADLGWIDS